MQFLHFRSSPAIADWSEADTGWEEDKTISITTSVSRDPVIFTSPPSTTWKESEEKDRKKRTSGRATRVRIHVKAAA